MSHIFIKYFQIKIKQHINRAIKYFHNNIVLRYCENRKENGNRK